MPDSVCLGDSEVAPTNLPKYLGLPIGSSIKNTWKLLLRNAEQKLKIAYASVVTSQLNLEWKALSWIIIVWLSRIFYIWHRFGTFLLILIGECCESAILSTRSFCFRPLGGSRICTSLTVLMWWNRFRPGMNSFRNVTSPLLTCGRAHYFRFGVISNLCIPLWQVFFLFSFLLLYSVVYFFLFIDG